MAQAQETPTAITREAVQAIIDHAKSSGGGMLPRLIITTDEGSTVTVSDGTTTTTLTPVSAGVWRYDAPKYGTYTVIAVLGQETASTTVIVDSVQIYNVDVEYNRIYGVEWDGTSTTAWSRTDAAASFVDPVAAVNNGTGSSPFDNKSPWKGMTIVEDEDAGTLVQIPKFYYKWTRTGSKMKLQISSKSFDGALVSPAHADRGDGKGERDIVYVGRYHCLSNWKSKSGETPKVSAERSGFRTQIHNLGSDIWQWDFAIYWTICMLYLVEYADWNSQAKIGYGCSDSGSIQNNGLTDAMQYHTGTNAASRTTYGHVQYRHIEDLWANVYDWIDGIYFYFSNPYGRIYCIKNPANFSDTAGGTEVFYAGSNPPFKYNTPTGGSISAWSNPSSISGFEYALVPSAFSGTDSTYICDYVTYYGQGNKAFRVGYYHYRSASAGLFALDGYYSYSGGSNAQTGSRLMKLP